MRDFLNAILAFIGSESLTDDEFDSVDIDDDENNSEVYNALLLILDGRESVTDMASRLKYYYLAKGVSFASDDQGKSNVFIGSKL
jgi:hypothetical protein